MKSFSSHKKKFLWLLHRLKLNEANKIKPIKLNYFINGHYQQYNKVIKLLPKNPVTPTNEILIKINIEPSNFLHDIQDPLNE